MIGQNNSLGRITTCIELRPSNAMTPAQRLSAVNVDLYSQ